MTNPENNKDSINELFYIDKLSVYLTIILSVIVFTLVFKYDFPVYLIYICIFSTIVFSLYRYVLFVKSKNIKSKKTKEGVIVEMGKKKWLEPRKYFSKVAIFLLIYTCLVGVFYLVTRSRIIAQVLIIIEFVIWRWLIKKGVVIKK